ncbi:MAG: class I SAM-dependent methyltransferase [Microthrixaceae bacterium]|nr:class I SAM-dependent methyltransferase [Microthrixaceae bacterium]
MLDVAAGSGAFSLRAARRGAAVTATDFAAGMVDLLSSRFAAEGHDRCTAEVMDGQALDLPDRRFDLSVSMFGVIFFPDIDAGLRELARVTRPGGRVAVATWDLAGFRLVDLVREALARALPQLDLPAGEPVWARIGDAAGLAAALGTAGLDPVRVHPVTRAWRWDDPEGFFRRLPAWSPPVQPLFEVLDADQIEDGAAAFAELVADRGGAGDGAGIDVTALLGVGVRPGGG